MWDLLYILFCKLLEITLYLCRGASGGKQYSNAQTYDYVDNLYSLLKVEDLPMTWPPRYCYLLEVMDGYPRRATSGRRGTAG